MSFRAPLFVVRKQIYSFFKYLARSYPDIVDVYNNCYTEIVKLPKHLVIKSIVVISFLLLTLLGGYLFLSLQEEGINEEAGIEDTTAKVIKPLPGSEKFTTKEYIQALEDNTAGSIYSSRAQLRGVVSSWKLGSIIEKGTLAIVVDEEDFVVKLPSEIELRCLPLTKISADGTNYKMSDVYVDLTSSQGVMVDAEVVAQKIPKGADITLQVDVDEDENMEATFILGYGCDV